MSAAEYRPGERRNIVLRALKQMKQWPEKWDQGSWRCGSACCFAGHLSLQAGYQWELPPWVDFEDAAGRKLRKATDSVTVVCPTNPLEKWDVQGLAYRILNGADRSGNAEPLFDGGNTFTVIVETCRDRGYITMRDADKLLSGDRPEFSSDAPQWPDGEPADDEP